jgi:hydrogenase nickel incorporation protein HypA/HybF
MHEFSIAEALAEQVLRHMPAGARVREVEIKVGILRGLEPEAMAMSWEAVTMDSPIAGSTLVMDIRPWEIHCGNCGRKWTSDTPYNICACGNENPSPTGGDELDLVSMTIDEDEDSSAGEGFASSRSEADG